MLVIWRPSRFQSLVDCEDDIAIWDVNRSLVAVGTTGRWDYPTAFVFKLGVRACSLGKGAAYVINSREDVGGRGPDGMPMVWRKVAAVKQILI